MDFIYPILAFCMIGMFLLRWFVFRPHWLGNMLLFGFLVVYIVIMARETLPTEAIAGVVLGCAIMVVPFHFLAKKRDKKRAKKLAAPNAPIQQNSLADEPGQQGAVVQAQTAPVKQTLKNCLRCGRSLHGPKCQSCGLDHTLEPVLLLCQPEPENLQIEMPK